MMTSRTIAGASPDAQQLERVRETVNSMQRRIRTLDALLDEQTRALDREEGLLSQPSSELLVNRRGFRLLQAALITAAVLAFTSGFVAGYNRLGF